MPASCFSGARVSLIAVAIHPIGYAQNVGSMVTAFFAFGAIISLINACDLPIDLFVWKARESSDLRNLWEEEDRRSKRAKPPKDVAFADDAEAPDGRGLAAPANDVAAANEANATDGAALREDAALTENVAASGTPGAHGRRPTEGQARFRDEIHSGL